MPLEASGETTSITWNRNEISFSVNMLITYRKKYSKRKDVELKDDDIDLNFPVLSCQQKQKFIKLSARLFGGRTTTRLAKPYLKVRFI